MNDSINTFFEEWEKEREEMEQRMFQEEVERNQRRVRDAFEAGWNAHKYQQLERKPFTDGTPRTDVEIAIDGGIKDPSTLSILYIKQKPQI